MTFSIGTCRVTVGFLFVAMLAFFLLLDTDGMAGPGIAAAALHECGHLAVLFCGWRTSQGHPVESLWRGNCTERGTTRLSAGGSSGPGRALCQPACGRNLHVALGTGAKKFAIANLMIGAMNLLPIDPLDGGQALHALLCPAPTGGDGGACGNSGLRFGIAAVGHRRIPAFTAFQVQFFAFAGWMLFDAAAPAQASPVRE